MKLLLPSFTRRNFLMATGRGVRKTDSEHGC